MDSYDRLKAQKDAILERQKSNVRRGLDLAVAALRKVGDDYPGSSCQRWCHEQADEALRIAGSTAERGNDGR